MVGCGSGPWGRAAGAGALGLRGSFAMGSLPADGTGRLRSDELAATRAAEAGWAAPTITSMCSGWWAQPTLLSLAHGGASRSGGIGGRRPEHVTGKIGWRHAQASRRRANRVVASAVHPGRIIHDRSGIRIRQRDIAAAAGAPRVNAMELQLAPQGVA